MLITKLDVIQNYYVKQKKTSWKDMLSESDYQATKIIWESLNDSSLTYEEYTNLVNDQIERTSVSKVTVFGEGINNTGTSWSTKIIGLTNQLKILKNRHSIP